MPIRWDRLPAEQAVQRLYRELFDREPERDILQGLVGYLTEGKISIRMQFMSMLKSEEFFDKRLRFKTPQDMAKELYRYILSRPAESAEALQGAADFVGNLGWRVQVDVMINSEEYLGRFGDDVVPSQANPESGRRPPEGPPAATAPSPPNPASGRRPPEGPRGATVPSPPNSASGRRPPGI